MSACRTEGMWLVNNGKAVEAMQVLAEGYKLLPTDESPQWWEEYGSTDLRHRYPLQYSYALLMLGKPDLAEQVVRQGLAIEPESSKERQDDYTKLTYQLWASLCAQNRFDEAIEDQEERKKEMLAKGAAEGELIEVKAWVGAVKARSGAAPGALEIFKQLSKHPQSVFHNLVYAAHLAAFLKEGEIHQKICREMMLRFASSADGEVAWRISWGMLCGRPDETILAIAHGMVDRVEESSGWYAEVVDLSKAILAYREERFEEALVTLERYRNDVPKSSTSKFVRKRLEGFRRFLGAAVYAELDRTEDAQREFAVGLEEMSRLRDKTSGSDRGREWHVTYGMETLRREAETLFKAKGIALPE